MWKSHSHLCQLQAIVTLGNRKLVSDLQGKSYFHQFNSCWSVMKVIEGQAVNCPSKVRVNSLESFCHSALKKTQHLSFFSTLTLQMTQPIMEQIKKENNPNYIMTNIHSVVWMLMDDFNLSFGVLFFTLLFLLHGMNCNSASCKQFAQRCKGRPKAIRWCY